MRHAYLTLRLSGSSARAEIDPAVAHTYDAPDGLLRTRGDRPWRMLVLEMLLEAPPHARRSTCIGIASGSYSVGSSARAEIDPRWVA